MTLDELEAAWNAQADRHHQWCDIGLDEKIAYVQQVEREACAACVPNNLFDKMLHGPDAVVRGVVDWRDINAVLSATRARIMGRGQSVGYCVPRCNAELRGASQLAGAASRPNAELGKED